MTASQLVRAPPSPDNDCDDHNHGDHDNHGDDDQHGDWANLVRFNKLEISKPGLGSPSTTTTSLRPVQTFESAGISRWCVLTRHPGFAPEPSTPDTITEHQN